MAKPNARATDQVSNSDGVPDGRFVPGAWVEFPIDDNDPPTMLVGQVIDRFKNTHGLHVRVKAVEPGKQGFELFDVLEKEVGSVPPPAVPTGEEFMAPIESIQIPALEVRPFERTEGWNAFLDSLRERGQTDAIWVSERERPVLIDGRHRLEGAAELGWTEIRCRVVKVTDHYDALLAGALANHLRKPLHWLDIGGVASTLLKAHKRRPSDVQQGGEVAERPGVTYSAEQLAIKFGIQRCALVRMVNVARLPEVAALVRQFPDTPRTVWEHLAFPSCPAEVRQTCLDLIRAGSSLSVKDVQAMKDEAAGKTDRPGDDPLGENGPAAGDRGAGGDDVQTSSPDERERPEDPDVGEHEPGEPEDRSGVVAGDAVKRRLPASVLGQRIRVSLDAGRIEFKISLDWPAADPQPPEILKAIKQAFEGCFERPGAEGVDSFKKLAERLVLTRRDLLESTAGPTGT